MSSRAKNPPIQATTEDELRDEIGRCRMMIDWFEEFFGKLSRNGIPPVGYPISDKTFRLQIKTSSGHWETWNG